MGAFVVREVKDGRQGEPAITRERNSRVTLQAIVVLIKLITLLTCRGDR